MSPRYVFPTGVLAVAFAAAATLYLTSLPVNNDNRFLNGPTSLSEEAKSLAVGCAIITKTDIKPGKFLYHMRYAGVTSRNEHVYRVFQNLTDTCFAYVLDKAPLKRDPFEGEVVSLSRL